MNFENKFPEWGNEGGAPPDELKTNGFQGKQKPPAAWLNWLCSLVGKCITELQNKFSSHSNDKNNPHGVTANQIGLVVDSELNENSDNLVKNKTVTAGINSKVNIQEGIGMMGFGTASNGGKTKDTILMVDSKTGVPVIKELVKYLSDLVADAPLPVSSGGTGAGNASDALKNLGGATTTTYTVTIPTSWVTVYLSATGETIYKQEVSVNGIMKSDSPIADVVISSEAYRNTYIDAWSLVFKIATSDNKITLYADKAPATSFDIQLKVVR